MDKEQEQNKAQNSTDNNSDELKNKDHEERTTKKDQRNNYAYVR